MGMIRWVLIGGLLWAGPAHAAISRERAEVLAAEFEAIWNPILSPAEKTLDVEIWWDRDDVNAEYNQWKGELRVILHGGLLRNENLSEDVFLTVACHELGHMVGGAPRHEITLVEKSSNEGQADYWASLKCLRRVFRAPAFAGEGKRANDSVGRACAASHGVESAGALICERSAMAGLGMMRLFETSKGDSTKISFDNPDPMEVIGILRMQPSFQCRLDTFVAGVLCEAPDDSRVSDSDPAAGACMRGKGSRPKCWYNPSRP